MRFKDSQEERLAFRGHRNELKSGFNLHSHLKTETNLGMGYSKPSLRQDTIQHSRTSSDSLTQQIQSLRNVFPVLKTDFERVFYV